MKKTLLLVTLLGGCLFVNAQLLQSDDFSALTLGNVGTDMTGVTPGQGGYLTFSNSGANSDWQIVNEGGTYGNVFQLTGPPTSTVATKFMWKDGLPDLWTSRTSGNDIIEIEYDFFTGPATTSKNTMDVRLYNASFQAVAGLRFVMETKVITGLARYEDANNAENTYVFNLGASSAPMPLAPDTWVRIGFAFNKTTGEVTWRGPGFSRVLGGSEMGVDPAEVDFLATTGTGNASAAIGKFDNLTIRATASEALLVVEEIEAPVSNSIKLYPNPVNDVLTLNVTNLTISNIEIMDLNGRMVKVISGNNTSDVKINVSDLSAGVYMINIYSENNKTTKKFMKN